jgi:hypothetical protein
MQLTAFRERQQRIAPQTVRRAEVLSLRQGLADCTVGTVIS